MAASVAALQAYNPWLLWLSSYDTTGITIVPGTPDTASVMVDFSGNGRDGATFGFGSPEMAGSYTTHHGASEFPQTTATERHRYIEAIQTITDMTMVYMGPMTPEVVNQASEIQLIHTGLGIPAVFWRWASGDTREVWWASGMSLTAAVAGFAAIPSWPSGVVSDEDAVIIYGITRQDIGGGDTEWRLIAAYDPSDGSGITVVEQTAVESATGTGSEHSGVMNEGIKAAGKTAVWLSALSRDDLIDYLIETAKFHSESFAAALTAVLIPSTVVTGLMGEALVSSAPGVQVSALMGEALVSGPTDFAEETEIIYDKLRKHIPRERVPPAEPALRSAATVLYAIRFAVRNLMQSSDRSTATGRWLDLYAASYGVTRLPAETDTALRLRLVDYTLNVTAENVANALTSLMGAFFEIYEWFDYPMALIPDGGDSIQFGIYVNVNRLPCQGGFIVKLPGGTTTSLGLQVINLVNNHKALGIPWLIVTDDYLGDAP